MEKIAEDLQESKLKQKSLGKAYQSVQALASSLIMSSVQWEDLEGHLESTRSSIEARFRELEVREKDIGGWAAQLEKREFEFDSKADELRGLETLLAQKLKEVTNCKNQLHSLQSLITEHSDEVLVKEKFAREKERECESKLGQLNEIQKDLELKEELAKAAQRSIEKCDKELILKEERLGSVQKSLAECSITLESKEKRIKEIELKERDLGVTKESLEEWSCELDVKERELGLKEDKVEELRKSVEEGERNLDTMSKGLQAKERKHADQARDLALKKKDFDSIRKSTEEHLKSKERQLEDRAKELQLKQKEFASIKKSAAEQTKILKSNERKLEHQAASMKKTTEEQTQILKAKEGQLEDKAKEIELKQKEFDSVIKSTEEQIRILKENERQLELQAKELELKQKEIDLMKQSVEEQARNLKSKENRRSILRAQVKIEEPEHIPSNHAVIPSSASNQCSTNWDGRGLQLFMNKHLKSIDSASSKITAHLQASNDPAKLVLDAMQGFYPSDVNVDNMECGFDLGIIRRSCIVLLETLKKVLPQINLQVKEEAIKLAGEWKAKMKTEAENWLEVLGFLRLVTIYDIASAYDAKELQSLITTVGENEQATELSQAVGCTEMESTSMVCCPVQTEKPESSLTKEAAATASEKFQLTAPALPMSPDPAKLLDVMQSSFAAYWEKNDVLSKEVVRFYINLLEQLTGVLLDFGVQVEIDALNLALKWKYNIRADTQHPLELLGFVQFTAKFGILTVFASDDILMFLGRISQHKETRELCQTLALADKIHAGFVQDLIDKKQLIEAVRVICTFKFCGTHPPVPLLKRFVCDLRQRCRKRARKKSLDEKDKVMDFQIFTLRDVIQCINDCNLESEYPPSDIENYIAALEKVKKDRRRAATPLACKVEPEEKDSLDSNVDQQEQKKSVASMVKQNEPPKAIASNVQQPEQTKPPPTMVVQQQQSKDPVPNVGQQELNKVEQHEKKRRWDQLPVQEQHRNKFQRTSGSAAITYALPIHTHNPHQNYTYLGQYGVAPNRNGLGSNCGPAQQFTYVGMRAPYNYAASAIPSPGMQYPYAQCMPSAPRYGPY